MDKIELLAQRELGTLGFDGDEESSEVKSHDNGNYSREFLNPSFFAPNHYNEAIPVFAYQQDAINHVRSHFHGLILENYHISVVVTDINTFSVHLERISN